MRWIGERVCRDEWRTGRLLPRDRTPQVLLDRVLIRAAALGEISEGDAADRRAYQTAVAARWNALRISPEIIDRARQPFPGEPIRLEALHLASALMARAAVAGIELLSLDDRIRAAARQLGFHLQPAQQAVLNHSS